jgi:hypothetical protein
MVGTGRVSSVEGVVASGGGGDGSVAASVAGAVDVGSVLPHPGKENRRIRVRSRMVRDFMGDLPRLRIHRL